MPNPASKVNSHTNLIHDKCLCIQHTRRGIAAEAPLLANGAEGWSDMHDPAVSAGSNKVSAHDDTRPLREASPVTVA